MAKGPPFRLLLIVTGSTLRAEEMDRPLSYYLKQRIEAALKSDRASGPHGDDDDARNEAATERAGQEHEHEHEHDVGPDPDPDLDLGLDLDDYIVRVVADFRWIHDEPLQDLPTISLGGPGVNALAHRWLEELPISLAYNQRYFIQMDPDLAVPRASIWGMDNATTQIAVSLFLDRFLDRFLRRCASVAARLVPPDDDDVEDVDDIDEEDDVDDIDDDEEGLEDLGPGLL